ncbi:fluoride efflux transporter FluC [Gordonia hydrophobica]|uniref:Fluoride-specific ion channel FluC n=1 Tax=Gordonia hydrophobica TaxID=40516 RepID=A0ABZ2U450_9ACTN|nr:CrcB family protein [Gordonia hydrophobica]MBM7368111.1 CrcB protein [Gordonia hydrophobica]
MSEFGKASTFTWVFVGGLFGTALRWGAEQAWPAHDGQWPWGTFVVNLVGAFILGALLEGLARLGGDDGWRRRARLAGGTGFCGALTTYSAFALEISLLGRGAHYALAIGYAVTSVVVGVLLAWTGVQAARRLLPLEGEPA